MAEEGAGRLSASLSLALGAVDVVVVLGNCVVLWLLASRCSSSSTSSSTNSLLLSLTLADLFLGIFILPLSIMQEKRGEWLYGEVTCRLWLSLDVFFSTASIYNLLAISFDRYMAVKQPLRYPIITSKRVIRYLLAAVWLTSCTLACVPLVLSRRPSASLASLECSPLSLPHVYIVTSAVASFILPALAMIALNALIVRHVVRSRSAGGGKLLSVPMRIHRGVTTRVKRKATQKEKRDGLSPSPNIKTADSGEKTRVKEALSPHLSNQSTRGMLLTTEEMAEDSAVHSFFHHILLITDISHKPQLILPRRRSLSHATRTELRVTRTTAVVVGTFICCWLPFTIIYLLQAYDVCPTGECVPEWVMTTAFWLGYANSALNPLLYAAFSRDIRASFRRALRRRLKY